MESHRHIALLAGICGKDRGKYLFNPFREMNRLGWRMSVVLIDENSFVGSRGAALKQTASGCYL